MVSNLSTASRDVWAKKKECHSGLWKLYKLIDIGPVMHEHCKELSRGIPS